MWLATRHGFFSVVEVTERPGTPWGEAEQGERVMVRSRSFRQLVLLKHLCPSLTWEPIYESRVADYPYRMVVTRSKWREAMAVLADDIDYGNFKDCVEAERAFPDSDSYVDALHRIWAILIDAFDGPIRSIYHTQLRYRRDK